MCLFESLAPLNTTYHTTFRDAIAPKILRSISDELITDRKFQWHDLHPPSLTNAITDLNQRVVIPQVFLIGYYGLNYVGRLFVSSLRFNCLVGCDIY